MLADGRVYVGTTTYGGRVAFRPAIVNYRSTEADVDLLVDVIRELGASLLGGGVSVVAQGSRRLSATQLSAPSRPDRLTDFRLPTCSARRSGRALSANMTIARVAAMAITASTASIGV